MKIPLKFILWSGLLLSAASLPRAEGSEAELRREIESLEQRLTALEERQAEEIRTIEWEEEEISRLSREVHEYAQKYDRLYDTLLFESGKKATLEYEDLRLGVHTTFVGQWTNNANSRGSGKPDRTAGSLTASLEIQKIFTELEGQAYIRLKAGSGAGLDGDLVLFSGVNSDASDEEEVTISEYWYDQILFGGSTVITVGKVSPGSYYDGNRAANDSGRQFLSGVFSSNPVIPFPDHSLGLNLAVVPAGWIELNAMLMNARGDELDDFGDHPFVIGQLAFKPSFFRQTGVYRFFAYYNKQGFTRWDDPGETNAADYGGGISFDQDLGGAFTAFLRYDWKNPEVYDPDSTATGGRLYSLEQGWSAGLQVRGGPWGRVHDILGVAVGQVTPSGDYKTASGVRAETEGHLECYYTMNLNPAFSLSPDLQYVWNPFGEDLVDNTASIFIFGLRCHVDF